jgi:hypothetical protein
MLKNLAVKKMLNTRAKLIKVEQLPIRSPVKVLTFWNTFGIMCNPYSGQNSRTDPAAKPVS